MDTPTSSTTKGHPSNSISTTNPEASESKPPSRPRITEETIDFDDLPALATSYDSLTPITDLTYIFTQPCTICEAPIVLSAPPPPTQRICTPCLANLHADPPLHTLHKTAATLYAFWLHLRRTSFAETLVQVNSPGLPTYFAQRKADPSVPAGPVPLVTEVMAHVPSENGELPPSPAKPTLHALTESQRELLDENFLTQNQCHIALLVLTPLLAHLLLDGRAESTSTSTSTSTSQSESESEFASASASESESKAKAKVKGKAKAKSDFATHILAIHELAYAPKHHTCTSHCAWIFTLSDNRDFVVALTDRQFGWWPLVVPLGVYVAERVAPTRAPVVAELGFVRRENEALLEGGVQGQGVVEERRRRGLEERRRGVEVMGGVVGMWEEWVGEREVGV